MTQREQYDRHGFPAAIDAAPPGKAAAIFWPQGLFECELIVVLSR
jgi:hypothetical protein